MIVLDANVIIGFLDGGDAHHAASVRILEDFVDEGYTASVLTVAEATVHPIRNGLQDRAAILLDDIGLAILPLDEEDALPLARIRAQYGLRMPDAVALHAALVTRSSLATFDLGLVAAARQAGVTVIGANRADER